MVGHCVCRSRCTGKSTTPSAVPDPGCRAVCGMEEQHFRHLRADRRRSHHSSVHTSFQIAAPSLRLIVGIIGQGGGQIIGKRIEEVHSCRPRQRSGSAWGRPGPGPQPETATAPGTAAATTLLLSTSGNQAP